VSVLRRLMRRYGVLMGNVGARVAALVVAAVTTFLVARTGGPALVGVLALLRVLPGLIGVVCSSGLPGSVTYFRAGPHREDTRLPLTIAAMVALGGALGAGVWIASSPLLGSILFPNLSLGLVVFAGALVLTKLCVATSKACLQGNDDLPGANRVIFAEEFMFLPAYGLLWALGLENHVALVAGLMLSDLATASFGWSRLLRRGFFARRQAPSLQLARGVASYGMRAQLGGVMSLLNLRLDFVLLSVLTGPAVLGVYAVASKFAELVKVPGMALTYVLYPRFARDGTAAPGSARAMLPKAALLTSGVVAPLWAATFLLPVVYGDAFKGAVLPAQIILVGLMLEGVAGVVSGLLYGIGRPGLNSWAMAAGLGVTVVLDLVLIPPFGATGAAVASAAAYVTTQLTLVWFFQWVRRSASDPSSWSERAVGADAR
jgi:O-antigen/teichoic acid export membrane protein